MYKTCGRESEMIERLKDMICEYVEADKNQISEDSRFMEDLGFTSFDFMSLIGEIEEEFDVEVDEREAADIKTVKEAIAYIERLQDQAD